MNSFITCAGLTIYHLSRTSRPQTDTREAELDVTRKESEVVLRKIANYLGKDSSINTSASAPAVLQVTAELGLQVDAAQHGGGSGSVFSRKARPRTQAFARKGTSAVNIISKILTASHNYSTSIH